MNQQQPIAERPLPHVSPLTAPFWDAARAHRFVVQQCGACSAWRFPPEIACPYCGSADTAWTEPSGRAELYSWTVTYPPLLPFFAARAPWPVAAVQLDEGPRLFTNLLDVEIDDYRVGMPLQVDFEDLDQGITLVVFRRRPDRSD